MSDPSPLPWFDIVIILALVLLNGVLSMSELAIVSSREARLKAMAKSGSSGAQCALDLAANPGRFLSTVQIGITLVGILAGAYSGATLGKPVGERVALLGLSPETAQTIGFAVVIILTTFASVVIGELVPKQFALRSPEPIAAIVARPMLWLSWLTRPIVWLLDRTSALIFKMLGLNRESENTVTAEELHLVVAEAQTAGVLEESERAIISGIVRLADRPVREVMTPRTDVDWVDVGTSSEDLRAALKDTPHSRIPVADGSVDNIVGVIQTRDLLEALLDGRELNLRELTRSAPVIPDLMDAMDALVVLRSADVPLALVHDEYGHFDGIVTPGSILAALAGTFAHDVEEGEEPDLFEREDGSWLVSGAASADLLSDRLGVHMPHDRDYSTVAGFALSVLKRLPQTGETFAHDGWKFEVVDMDGRKIDKLLVSRPKRRSREHEPAQVEQD
ncbi:HlyC/CorC family transporter [Sphingomonas sediminicola]|uniref:HlyC/CorC family transporter n=1 Tax=Sphingomonas sediminicola TaxID=386874 RepID=A0ABX6T6Y1_9SPHN|nr:hemolysin family protein [Sphingomonas sediminicola]QNP45309.1 HlyC/CorC family transporter [Sphingomonas sediminicola]